MRWDDIIASLTTTLASTSEQIVCAYLFGSVARGEQRPGSDVDIAVLFGKSPPKTPLGLRNGEVFKPLR